MKTQILVPTRKEIYNMFVLGLTLDNVLELDINFATKKDAIDFCKLVNEVYENLPKNMKKDTQIFSERGGEFINNEFTMNNVTPQIIMNTRPQEIALGEFTTITGTPKKSK